LGLIDGGGVAVEFPEMVLDGALGDDVLGGGGPDDMIELVAEAVAGAVEDKILVVVVVVGGAVVEITVDFVPDIVLVDVVVFAKRTGVVLVANVQ
jgi:hypothetical protein